MDGDWDSIRSQLGGDLNYGTGSWFLVPERSALRRGTERPFAQTKAADDTASRPVVLAGAISRPNATMFPRTTQGRINHRAHRHRCKINKDGRVEFSVPVTVDRDSLDEANYSCLEPEGTGLYEEIERRLRP